MAEGFREKASVASRIFFFLWLSRSIAVITWYYGTALEKHFFHVYIVYKEAKRKEKKREQFISAGGKTKKIRPFFLLFLK